MEAETSKTKSSDNKKSPKRFRFLRFVGKLLLFLILFLFIVILFVRSPWGQDLIVQRAVRWASEKTDSEITIDQLFITFDGDVAIEKLYLEDVNGDTLLYSKSLEVDVPLWPIISGDGIGVDEVKWKGLTAHVSRPDSITGFNFDFLIAAFAPQTEEETAQVEDSTQIEISLGDFYFTDFDLSYQDAVTGIDAELLLQDLQIEIDEFDLKNMGFALENVEVDGLDVVLLQEMMETGDDEDSEDTALPTIQVKHLTLSNIAALYETDDAVKKAEIDLKELLLENANINLSSERYSLEMITLSDSYISLVMDSAAVEVEETAVEVVQEESTFEWPELVASVGRIDLQNNTLDYRIVGQKAVEGIFNPNALLVDALTLEASDIAYQNQSVKAELAALSFQEKSGLEMKEARFDLKLDDEGAELNDLLLSLNQNYLQGELSADYPSLQALIDAPEDVIIESGIAPLQLDVADAFLFEPSLQENEYVAKLAERLLSGEIYAEGNAEKLFLTGSQIAWGENTSIRLDGNVSNLTQPDDLAFNFPQITAETKRKDLLQFISEEELGVQLPKDLSLDLSAKGTPTNMDVDALLKSSFGSLTANATYRDEKTMEVEGEVAMQDFQLDKLLDNEQLGATTFTLQGQAKGKDLNSLNGELEAELVKMKLNDYAIEGLKLDGTIADGKGDLNSRYKDENLNAELAATFVLDSVAPEVNVNLDLIGADLNALGVTQKNLRAALKLDAGFKGTGEKFDVHALVNEGVVVMDNDAYQLGAIDLTAHVEPDTTSLLLLNEVVYLDLKSNTDPTHFIEAMQRHLVSYFTSDSTASDSIVDPVLLKLDGKVSQSPILDEVLVDALQDLDTIRISVDFQEEKRILDASVSAPHIDYGGNEIDSLLFSLESEAKSFRFDLGFEEVSAGPVVIKKTEFSGTESDGFMDLQFISFHEEDTLMHVLSTITGKRDSIAFHVIPEEIVLNAKQWQMPKNNAILYKDSTFAFQDFELSRNAQSVTLTDKMPKAQKEHVALLFENFKLSDFLGYFNPDDKLASGELQGDLVLEEPYGNTGLLADLDIDNLQVLEAKLGNFSLDASSKSFDKYDVEMRLKEGDIDLDLTGDFTASGDEPELRLDLALNQVNMKAVEGFVPDELSETSGYLSGSFKVSGTTSQPVYQGYVSTNQAKFKLTRFNATFQLPNEKLGIDNEGLALNKFTILDENGNSFRLSGDVLTETLLNPDFDLEVDAENFQVLNATKEDNDWLYGTAAFDMSGTVKGNLEIPLLDLDITVDNNTDATYVLPTASANFEERDGVVTFVNRENPDAIITRNEEVSATLAGFDVRTTLKIGKEAQMTIIIDEETGDYFRVAGEGDLQFSMDPSGRMTLAGVYDIRSGVYEMNLYNLVNRRFELAPDSKISWSGDPFDAKLDVRAIYRQEASSAPLMASVSSGLDPSSQIRYKQVLPFLIYLNVDGTLDGPELSFNLDMPEDAQGAIGGQVYGRLQQVNRQETELNKQVFSLLVLNRFYPEPGSDGSTGGITNVARNNINDALSDQLDTYADRLMGESGIELDFGLNSYTDYQGESPEDRTQLDVAAQKTLFDDRLVVSVGSEVDIQGGSTTGQSAPLIGKVSIEYMLTQDGQYRLKGFRRNEFENVIDGQTIVSGFALIFSQEFNEFDELKRALLRQAKEEVKPKEKDEELEKIVPDEE